MIPSHGPSESLFAQRLQRLARAVKREKLDAILVWDRANTRYLCGFAGSASLICVLPHGSGYFLTDSRYITLAKETIRHLEVHEIKPPAEKFLARLLHRRGIRKVGFEEMIPYSLYRQWGKALKVELIETTALIRSLREQKNRNEIAAIADAQRMTERAFERVLALCRPGMTERALARAFLHAIEDEGGEGPAFDPIIASGPNAAIPHARPGDRALQRGDFVVFDLGARCGGYHSDMTRTVVIGRASERQRRLYDIVREAQRRAVAVVREGVLACEVDKVARRWIDRKGFGRRFRHRVGHGVGLEIHESPSLNSDNRSPLRRGMVITVEPGIYIEGWGGVRIEDMVRVTPGGGEVLTRWPHRLLEI